MSSINKDHSQESKEDLVAENRDAGQARRLTSRKLALAAAQYEEEEKASSADGEGYGTSGLYDSEDDIKPDIVSHASAAATESGARPLKRSRVDGQGTVSGSVSSISSSYQSTSTSINLLDSDELARLHEKISLLEAENKRLEAENKDYANSLDEIEYQVEDLADDKEQLKAEVARLGEQATKHATEMQHEKQACADAVVAKDQAHAILYRTRNELANMTKRATEVEKTLDDVKKQFGTYRTEVRQAALDALQAAARAEGVWNDATTRKRVPGSPVTLDELEQVFESAVKAIEVVKPLLLSG